MSYACGLPWICQVPCPDAMRQTDLMKSFGSLNVALTSMWMLLRGPPAVLSADSSVAWSQSQNSRKGALTVSYKLPSMMATPCLQEYHTVQLSQSTMQWQAKLPRSLFCAPMASLSRKFLRILLITRTQLEPNTFCSKESKEHP